MLQDEILYSIALRATPNIGDINFMKLIDAAGSAKEAWLLSKKLLKEIPGFGSKIIKNIGNDEFLKFAENELIFCEKNNIKIKLRRRRPITKTNTNKKITVLVPEVIPQTGTVIFFTPDNSIPNLYAAAVPPASRLFPGWSNRECSGSARWW